MQKDFNKIIKFHRQIAGLSQVELARLAGVGKTVVYDIEKGKETTRMLTLQKVLDALNIKLSWDSPLKKRYLDSGSS
jgi:ribosome-binding protein aMBF1 (putative translation factor)